MTLYFCNFIKNLYIVFQCILLLEYSITLRKDKPVYNIFITYSKKNLILYFFNELLNILFFLLRKYKIKILLEYVIKILYSNLPFLKYYIVVCLFLNI